MSDNNARSASTQIPLPLVDPSQLPSRKGLNYKDITHIVGNLYIETYERIAVAEDQLRAIAQEYQLRLSNAEKELNDLRTENMKLRQELQRRESRPSVTPNTNG